MSGEDELAEKSIFRLLVPLVESGLARANRPLQSCGSKATDSRLYATEVKRSSPSITLSQVRKLNPISILFHMGARVCAALLLLLCTFELTLKITTSNVRRSHGQSEFESELDTLISSFYRTYSRFLAGLWPTLGTFPSRFQPW